MKVLRPLPTATAVGTALALCLAPATVGTASADDEPLRPVVADGVMQPVFTDSRTWVRDELWVETEFDSDGDGLLDRMHVTITRPGETETSDLKVPVVYQTSPYYAGGNNVQNWSVNHELGFPPAGPPPYPNNPASSTSPIISTALVSTWVPRGFAVVHSESPGTGLSTGCPTTGGTNESLAPKAVIDWLNGRARGFTSLTGTQEVTADWSTGKVGMTGTSYNGTLPIGVATTGVEGLEAIVPVSAISDWYDYYRSNGLVVAPGGYQGEDADILAAYVHTRPDRTVCAPQIVEMQQTQDRATGDRNAFWDERNYLDDVDGISAATLIAHGLGDWNVKASQATNLWSELQERGVPSQIYLHQGGHGGAPPDLMMNLWFSRFLYDVPNGVEEQPRAWVAREGANRLNPTPYASWPVPGSRPVPVGMAGDGSEAGDLRIMAREDSTQDLTDNAAVRALNLASAASSDHRLLYRSRPLLEPVHLSGEPQVSITLSADRPAVNLSTAVVATAPNGTSRILTRGFADPQNAADLDGVGTPLVPGQEVTVDFTYEPIDTVVAAGSTLAVMVYSSDNEYTIRPAAGSRLSVDLGSTSATLPVVGGPLALARATRDVPAYARSLVAWSDEHGRLSTQNAQQLAQFVDKALSFAAAGKTHQARQHLDHARQAAERVADEELRQDLLDVVAELLRMLEEGRL